MTLLFLVSLAVFAALLLWRRDRRYLKKNLTDVLRPQIKEELNLPGSHTRFENGLEPKIKQHSKSREILKQMNQ